MHVSVVFINTAQTTGDAINEGVTSAGAASKALFKKFD